MGRLTRHLAHAQCPVDHSSCGSDPMRRALLSPPTIQRRGQRLRRGTQLPRVTAAAPICVSAAPREGAYVGSSVGHVTGVLCANSWGFGHSWRMVSELPNWPSIWGSGAVLGAGTQGPRTGRRMEEWRPVPMLQASCPAQMMLSGRRGPGLAALRGPHAVLKIKTNHLTQVRVKTLKGKKGPESPRTCAIG